MLPDLPRGLTLYPVDLGLSLNDFERQIASEAIEVSAAFDLEGRLVLRPRSGAEEEVEYAPVEIDSLEDTIVTHNHPSGWPPSAADAEFAAERDVAELRVVCPDGVLYRLLRPSKGWPSSDKMIEAVEDSVLTVRQLTAQTQISGMGQLTEAQRKLEQYRASQRILIRLGVSLLKTSVWEGKE